MDSEQAISGFQNSRNLAQAFTQHQVKTNPLDFSVIITSLMIKMNKEELERKLKRERVEACLNCKRFVKCDDIGKFEECADFRGVEGEACQSCPSSLHKP